MKKHATFLRWMAALLLVGASRIAFCQTAEPATTKPDPAAPVLTADEQNAEQLLAELLKSYKDQLAALNSTLNDADVESAMEAKTPQERSHQPDGAADKKSATNAKSEQGALRLGHLEIGHVQAGSLPLTLPDVPTLVRPAIEYQGTMYQKAIYEKALADRYRFFHDLNSK